MDFLYRTATLQVIAQSLKTRQQNGPKLEILQTAIRYMFDYLIFIIVAHMKKKIKNSVVTKTTSPTGKW